MSVHLEWKDKVIIEEKVKEMDLLEAAVKGYLGREGGGGKKPGDSSAWGVGRVRDLLGEIIHVCGYIEG